MKRSLFETQVRIFPNYARIFSNQEKERFRNITDGLIFDNKPPKLPKYSEFNSSCEWTNDFLIENDSSDYYWLYKNNGNNNYIYYGVCNINDESKVFKIKEKTYICFYIITECGISKTNNNYITRGRLLWCYIINHIYNTIIKEYKNDFFHNPNNIFLIFNQSTDEAKEYHLKMGMHPFKTLELGLNNNNKELFKNYLGQFHNHIYSENSENLKNSKNLKNLRQNYNQYFNINDNRKGGFLFYIFQKEITYNDIFAIYTSLPLSNRGFLTLNNRRSKKQKGKGYKPNKLNKYISSKFNKDRLIQIGCKLNIKSIHNKKKNDLIVDIIHKLNNL